MAILGLVTVWNRFEETRVCVDSILETAGDRVQLIIADNASDEHFYSLLNYYQEAIKRGQISVLLNGRKFLDAAGVKCSKPYSMNQALGIARATFDVGSDFFFVIDNDIKLHPGWLNWCLDVLGDGGLHAAGVRMACPFENPYVRQEIRDPARETKSGRRVKIHSILGGAFWFGRLSYWLSLAPPTCYRDIECHDDMVLFSQMISRKHYFAVPDGETFGEFQETESARLKYKEENCRASA